MIVKLRNGVIKLLLLPYFLISAIYWFIVKVIATTSEPWILLPFLFSTKEKGVYAEYSHKVMVQAVDHFCRELPGGMDDYFEELRTFAVAALREGVQWRSPILPHKTPRYHLVVDDVIRLFPDGKFIFLWRNPLAVIASIIETWGQGKWNLYLCKVDLFDGLENLISCIRHTQVRSVR